MNKMKSVKFLSYLILAATLWACDSSTGLQETAEPTEEKQFVWNGMNAWYFWQADVHDLADERFSSEQEFFQYLNGFTDEKAVFEALINRSEDDFSFFIDNYEEFEESRQGRSVSFGFSYGLVRPGSSQDIFGYVQYVFDSAAEDAGLKRGDIFTRVNGTRLTTSNFRNLLNQNSVELTLSVIESTAPFALSETGETINIFAEHLQEDPLLLSEIIDTGSCRVGYLVYNAFRYNFHEELNNKFGEFISEGIDELVLDLRYNGGGAVISSSLLASLISGKGSSNTFAALVFNDKQQDNNQFYHFLDEIPVWDRQGNFVEVRENINKLSLDRLYVLTSNSTASASEALINGLEPFIEVIPIGLRTVGKDEGSITVYDTPPDYDSSMNANPNHMRAIQPIVFKIFNERMEGYANGFFPFEEIREIDYLLDLPPLGDKNEPLLAAALELITGQVQPALVRQRKVIDGDIYMESRDFIQSDSEMYLVPGEYLSQ